MSESQRLLERAVALRRAFDRSFAAPLPAAAPAELDVLAIRCGEHALALRLSEVRSIHTDRRVVPAPAPTAELLGLVSVRGIVTPVYDLDALLGYERATAPRWLAVARTAAPFALAFAAFEGHLRLPLERVVAVKDGATTPHAHARASVLTDAGPRALIDLAELFEKVTGRHRRETAPIREEA